MGLLLAIDNILLRHCTKFAHWFQKLTGRTCYFIAKIGIAMATMATIISLINYFFPMTGMDTERNYLRLILWIWLIASSYYDVANLDKLDNSSQQSAEKVESVWLGVSKKSTWHITLLVISCLALPATIGRFIDSYIGSLQLTRDTLFFTGILVFYYFIAVEPLRPQKSRIHQWVESLSFTPAPVPSGSKN